MPATSVEFSAPASLGTAGAARPPPGLCGWGDAGGCGSPASLPRGGNRRPLRSCGSVPPRAPLHLARTPRVLGALCGRFLAGGEPLRWSLSPFPRRSFALLSGAASPRPAPLARRPRPAPLRRAVPRAAYRAVSELLHAARARCVSSGARDPSRASPCRRSAPGGETWSWPQPREGLRTLGRGLCP